MELELEHEVPPPNDTSQNPSHFQPSVKPDPEINAAGRAVRKKRLTWKLLQQLPAPPSPLPEPLTAFQVIEPISETSLPNSEVVWRAIKTSCNSFGLYREYPDVPSHNPDNTLFLLSSDFVEVGRKEWYEEKEKFQSIIFDDHPVDVGKLKAYLEDVSLREQWKI
jgi:hypothetical protein